MNSGQRRISRGNEIYLNDDASAFRLRKRFWSHGNSLNFPHNMMMSSLGSGLRLSPSFGYRMHSKSRRGGESNERIWPKRMLHSPGIKKDDDSTSFRLKRSSTLDDINRETEEHLVLDQEDLPSNADWPHSSYQPLKRVPLPPPSSYIPVL